MGQPGGEFSILTDVCLGLGQTLTLHNLYGSVSATALLMPASTPDPALYNYAHAHGYDAIFTADSNLSGGNDLCVAAREAFTYYDPRHEGVNTRPAVIVVPAHINEEDASKLLTAHQKEITAHIKARKDAVLSL